MQPAGRLRVTAYAAAQAGLAVPTLVLFVLWVVGAALLVVWVGAVLLTVAVPGLRALADVHRRMAATLGIPVPQPYRPLPTGNPVVKLLVVLRDPMTWRDLAWTLWAFTLAAPRPQGLPARSTSDFFSGLQQQRHCVAQSGSRR